MFTKTIIKVFQFGLPTNLPTDTKIKITKLLAISPIVHSINQLGKWDGLLVLIHTTQIVKLIQLTLLQNNSTLLWLLVLKTLDLIWLIKLVKFLMELCKYQNLSVLHQLGIHAECALMELC